MRGFLGLQCPPSERWGGAGLVRSHHKPAFSFPLEAALTELSDSSCPPGLCYLQVWQPPVQPTQLHSCRAGPCGHPPPRPAAELGSESRSDPFPHPSQLSSVKPSTCPLSLDFHQSTTNCLGHPAQRTAIQSFLTVAKPDHIPFVSAHPKPLQSPAVVSEKSKSSAGLHSGPAVPPPASLASLLPIPGTGLCMYYFLCLQCSVLIGSSLSPGKRG